jgi:hypothetical protein
MAERGSSVKAQPPAEIDKAWADLNTFFAGLSEAQMTTLHDGQGWTVKDHLTHIAAWEESVIFFLHGRPRHEALGIEEPLFAKASFDEINAVIQRLQPLRHYLPNSPADDRRRAVDLIRDNTSGHFSEHLPWMRAIGQSD